MSNDLIEKLRKARQSTVEVGGYKFVVTRPTDAEAVGLRAATMHEVISRFVVGWEGVKEIDIFGGGNPTDAEFDPELWAEWSADHPEFWEPIVNEVLRSYRSHRGLLEEEAKN